MKISNSTFCILHSALFGVVCLAFFLIVPSVIIVTIFLVHSVAERLGFRVKYFSLILCAVMSLAVNFAAIQMSTYLDKWHYIRLGVLVLFASLAVTLVNRYLIKHDKSDVVIIDEEETLKEAEAEENLEKENITEDIQENKQKESNIIKTVKEEKSAASDKIVEKTEVETKPKLSVKPAKDGKSNEDKTSIKNEVTKKQDDSKAPVKTPIKSSTVNKSTEEKSTIKSIENKKIEVKTKAELNTDTKITTAKLPVKTESKPEIKTAKTIEKQDIKSETKPVVKAVDKPEVKTVKTSDKSDVKPIKIIDKSEDKSSKTINKITDKPVKPIDNKIQDKILDKKDTKDKTTEQKVPTDKMADINAHLGSLDDILDYAYAQKAKGNLNQAVLAYQKALDRYKNDDYAPFIAIDLGNIYKEQAAYSRVIKTYEEALKLPVVMRNAETRKEFTKNLAYLRVVQSVLVRHRAITTPFSKIPRQYLQEVETELKSAQLNNSLARRKI